MIVFVPGLLIWSAVVAGRGHRRRLGPPFRVFSLMHEFASLFRRINSLFRRLGNLIAKRLIWPTIFAGNRAKSSDFPVKLPDGRESRAVRLSRGTRSIRTHSRPSGAQRFAVRIACHTLNGVNGIVRSKTPSGASASSTALTTTANAGVQPPSPPALMPNGLVGDSTSTIRV
jgi:hypothetical protein